MLLQQASKQTASRQEALRSPCSRKQSRQLCQRMIRDSTTHPLLMLTPLSKPVQAQLAKLEMGLQSLQQASLQQH